MNALVLRLVERRGVIQRALSFIIHLSDEESFAQEQRYKKVKNCERKSYQKVVRVIH